MELKKVQDYYEKLFKLYPDIPKKDIKRIMQFGLKSFLLHNNYGGDVLLQNPTLWMYCGKLMKDSIKYFEYYKRKMIIKIRIQHKRLEIPWDGYYYFGMYEQPYSKYLNQKKSRGRPKKYLSYGDIVLYKYYDECNLRNSGAVAIFKVPYPDDFGLSMYKSDYITDKAELVCKRNPLTFKEILASNYNYQFVKDYTKWKKKKSNDGCNKKSNK